MAAPRQHLRLVLGGFDLVYEVKEALHVDGCGIPDPAPTPRVTSHLEFAQILGTWTPILKLPQKPNFEFPF